MNNDLSNSNVNHNLYQNNLTNITKHKKEIEEINFDTLIDNEEDENGTDRKV